MQQILNKIMGLFDYKTEIDISTADKFAKYAFIAVLTIITYIATVSTASTLITSSIMGNKAENYGSLTVEFFGMDGETSGILTNKQKTAVLKLLQSTPGIKNVRNITNDEMKNMFEKWVPGVEIPANMPMPTLFNAELSGIDSVNISSISNELSHINKNVRIYDHSVMNSNALKINGMFKMVTMFLAILSTLMICAAVYHFTNSSASANKNTLKILRMIGASKKYIIDQFKSLNILMSCRAIGISTAISLITFILCYNILCPIDILKYSIICASLMLVIPAIMLLIVVGVSEMSMAITYGKSKMV